MARSITVTFLGNSRDLTSSIDQVEGKTSTLGSRMAKVGKVMTVGLAVGAHVAGKALIGMTKNAAADEAAQRKLALALRNTAGATDGQIASVEDWISAQGRALGVTDDELRPAFQRLVQATGDVGEAQKLARIAMDASAGSGKSLKTVTEAIAKAQNGNLGSLSRLGVAIKDANGNTLNFDQAMKGMAQTFRGQAAAGAATLDGKMARLRVIFDETRETVGAKLIPVVEALADWFLNKGIPAVSGFARWVGRNKTAILAMGAAILGATALVALHGTAMAVAAAGGLLPFLRATRLVSTATKVWTAFQWLLNAALTANPIGLVVVALAALGVAVVIAWKKSDTFRRVVMKAWNAIRSVTATAFGAVRAAVAAAWGFITRTIPAGVRTALNAVRRGWAAVRVVTTAAWAAIVGVISARVGAIRETITRGVGAARDRLVAAWSAVRERTKSLWAAVVDAVRVAVGRIGDVVRGIKDRVVGALAGAGTWLVGAGKAIIQGLIDGITAMFGKLRDRLASVTRLIPDWKGPARVDRRLLYDNGRLIMQGLTDGMESAKPSVRLSLANVTQEIASPGPRSSQPLRPSARPASVVNQWTVNFNGLVGDPVSAGRQFVQVVKKYERTTGTRVLLP